MDYFTHEIYFKFFIVNVFLLNILNTTDLL